jgi:ABC-2 type transport system permease protein
MTAEALVPARNAPTGLGGAGPALTWLAVRQIRRTAGIVLIIAAGMPALVATQYRGTFAPELDGPAMQALATNPAIRTLFGPPLALDHAGGFTVWRTGTPVAVLVGAWALLAATRLTRGEEEAGRWDLLRAGPARTVDLVTRAAGVLACAVLAIGAGVAVVMITTGSAATGAVLYGAGISGVGLGFAALGTCAAQVLPTRAAATALAAAGLGAAQLARMVADGVEGLGWLRWLTPFGVAAELRPYAGDRPAPLLLLGVAPLVLTAGAALAARRRDAGSGLLPAPTRRRARTRLMRSLGGFAVRRTLGPLAGWALGVGAYFLLVGSLAGSVTTFLSDNPRFAQLAATAGFTGLGSVSGYAAAMLELLAIPAGVYAAVRIAAAATEETSRRAVLLFASPVSRVRLAATEIAVTAAGVAVLLATAAFALWAGTCATGAPLPLVAALTGAVNVAPIALLCLGAATLGWGVRPGAVAAVGALPAVGGFLLHVIAQSTGAAPWVAMLSPFAHLAPVPHVPPHWPEIVGLTGAAALLALVGIVGYRRRDLAL